MTSNIIAFPQRSNMANTSPKRSHATHAANSPIGPGIALPGSVRMRSLGGSSPVAGRMVLTGRLADVCAELSRMAALEACA